MRELEKQVLGCDFGGTSWTTRIQAEKIPAALGLRKGVSLLEIGAGTGWPGIFTAGISACDLTLLDLPVNSLKYANSRCVEEHLPGRNNSVAASGEALPFATGSFHAVCHSDVLCCLPEKLAMLQECRRVVMQGAHMLFFVIAPVRGLDERKLAEAIEAGPPFVGTPDDYGRLLRESGWELLERADLTDEYLGALGRLVSGLEKGADTLPEILGKEGFIDQLARRRLQVAAIEDGLLQRELFLARAA